MQEIFLNNTSGLSQSTFIKIVHQTYLVEINLEDVVNVNPEIQINVEVTTSNNTIGTQTDFETRELNI